MEKEERNAIIRGLIFDTLGGNVFCAPFKSADDLKPETRLREDLNADSIDEIELLMEMEEAFDIDVPEEVAATVRTVGDIYKLADIML